MRWRHPGTKATTPRRRTPRLGTPVLVGGLVVDVAARRGAHRLAHPVGGLGATAGRCVARTDMARASSVTPRRLVLAVARRARAAGASCEVAAAAFRVFGSFDMILAWRVLRKISTRRNVALNRCYQEDAVFFPAARSCSSSAAASLASGIPSITLSLSIVTIPNLRPLGFRTNFGDVNDTSNLPACSQLGVKRGEIRGVLKVLVAGLLCPGCCR